MMHVVFRSLLEIFGYAAKQACKQLQCNKAKLSEPASINGLHNPMDCEASLLCVFTDEDLGGHIYTVRLIDILFEILRVRVVGPGPHLGGDGSMCWYGPR